jgi:hypothetical protein
MMMTAQQREPAAESSDLEEDIKGVVEKRETHLLPKEITKDKYLAHLSQFSSLAARYGRQTAAHSNLPPQCGLYFLYSSQLVFIINFI